MSSTQECSLTGVPLYSESGLHTHNDQSVLGNMFPRQHVQDNTPTHDKEDVKSGFPVHSDPNEGPRAGHRLEAHSPIAGLLETVVCIQVWVTLYIIINAGVSRRPSNETLD